MPAGSPATADGGYTAIWAHDEREERAALERWVDDVTERLARHPDMHVYHYNHTKLAATPCLRAWGRRAGS